MGGDRDFRGACCRAGKAELVLGGFIVLSRLPGRPGVGNVLVITRLSRAMRSLKHLLALAGELRERGIGLVVLKQHIDTTTPAGRLVFHILGAIDEFQPELIVEGTREGLEAAPVPAAAPAAANPN
jgi:hypothetical protein